MASGQELHTSGTKRSFPGASDYEPIVRLIGAVGTDAFYDEVFKFVAAGLGCTRWILMRYRRFGKPEVLINTAGPDHLLQFYFDGLYRLDPLLRLVVEGDPPSVVTFESVRKGGKEDEEYNELYRLLQIQDELVIFMPEIAGTYMAFCLERETANFTCAEIDQVRAQYPLLNSLHRLHVERSLARELEATNEGTRRILLTNSRGEFLHQSHDWTESERAKVDHIVAGLPAHGNASEPIYFDDQVLHWEDLPETHPLAPGGRMFVLERSSPGYIKGGVKASLDEFARRVNLTRRERDLVDLTLRGYPTSTIAQKLDLTVGTVKMYKHRLYEKLDITSEREIFLQFIEFLFKHTRFL